MKFTSIVIGILLVSAWLSAYDNYPWIHTALQTVGRSWTSQEKVFAADHYEIVVGALATVTQTIHDRNPDVKTFQFVSLSYFSPGMQDEYFRFISENPGQYSNYEIEDAFLHYDCDTESFGAGLIPGCYLKDPNTGECWGFPDPNRNPVCAESNALWWQDSRVPDWWDVYEWFTPNYQSRAYRDFAPWRIQEVEENYPEGYLAHGIFWDNILYVPGYVDTIENTNTYPGISDDVEPHPRTQDLYDLFLNTMDQVDADVGRHFLRYGNANGFAWIRSLPDTGPFIEWILANLEYVTPEGWVFHSSYGEQKRPAWNIDCWDLREAWQYTMIDGIKLHTEVYNHDGSGGNRDMWTREFGIAKYYLVTNPNLYYGTREQEPGGTLMDYRWNPMAEVNIGMPKINPPGVKDFDGQTGTNKFFDFMRPGQQLSCNDIFQPELLIARHFDNGLLLVRYKPNRFCNPPLEEGDPECTAFQDPREYHLNHFVSNPDGGLYYKIQTDGSLAANPISSITLRTDEVALLLNACDEGQVPDGTACGCGGIELSGGQWCCGGQPKTVCINDIQCQILGGGSVCENPGTCQAECTDPEGSPSPTVEACEDLGGQCLDDCSERDDCSLDESGYCGVGVCCLGVCTATATPSATPTPEPCTPEEEGISRACDVSGCSGSQSCESGEWSICVKTDLCCGVNCDDGNSCTSDACAGGVCSHVAVCGDGGNNGGSNDGPFPTATPTPVPSVVGADTPSPTVDWQGLDPEVQEQLTEMYESGEDTREVEQLMLDALEARDAGDDEKAVSLMDRARERLRELVLKARSSKASFTWWYALVALVIIVGLAIYYASSFRKPPEKPASPIDTNAIAVGETRNRFTSYVDGINQINE